jgi:hypothetical protein
MVTLKPIEIENPKFFLHILQMLNICIFANTAYIYAIARPVPHTCQQITVFQSHSSGDMVAKILEINGELRHTDSVIHKPPET